jgi:hypothetical protein
MVYDYLGEDDYTTLQQFLREQPEAADVVNRSGGVRVCYYTRNAAGQMLMQPQRGVETFFLRSGGNATAGVQGQLSPRQLCKRLTQCFTQSLQLYRFA